MTIRTVGAYQARQNFGQLLEQVFYQQKSFLVKRGRKAMAYLVGQPFFAALFDLLEKDKGLADTLAVMTNQKAAEIIEKGSRDIKTGKTYPLKELLKS